MATNNRPPHLLLHKLIVALSYWGTAVRSVLFTIVLGFALFVPATGTTASFEEYSVRLIVIVGMYMLLDAGYTTIARALPFKDEGPDHAIFLAVILLYAVMAISPYFVRLPAGLYSPKLLLLAPFFVVALRLMVGVLYGHSRRG